MSLADRTIGPSQHIGKIDRLLTDLDDADRDWLLRHLTEKSPTGTPVYPAQRLAAELADEDPAWAISPSLIREWRRNHA